MDASPKYLEGKFFHRLVFKFKAEVLVIVCKGYQCHLWLQTKEKITYSKTHMYTDSYQIYATVSL